MIYRQTTKELIADSLKELFTHKTADKITVKEIAQNCGITPATFYQRRAVKRFLLFVSTFVRI